MHTQQDLIRAVVFVLLTGVLAFVILVALLAFGVPARLVFLPGFAVKRWFEHAGAHLPNGVGVMVTGLVYWAAVIAIRFAIVAILPRRDGRRL